MFFGIKEYAEYESHRFRSLREHEYYIKKYCKIADTISVSNFVSFGKEVSAMQFNPKERGQGLLEYALILVLVVLVVIIILSILGVSVFDLWENAVYPLCEVFAPGLCP